MQEKILKFLLRNDTMRRITDKNGDHKIKFLNSLEVGTLEGADDLCQLPLTLNVIYLKANCHQSPIFDKAR